jgi:hypothetical protein
MSFSVTQEHPDEVEYLISIMNKLVSEKHSCNVNKTRWESMRPVISQEQRSWSTYSRQSAEPVLRNQNRDGLGGRQEPALSQPLPPALD